MCDTFINKGGNSQEGQCVNVGRRTRRTTQGRSNRPEVRRRRVSVVGGEGGRKRRDTVDEDAGARWDTVDWQTRGE